MWGIAPALGRGFTAAECQLGGPSAVLISDRYWRGRLGADPGVLAGTVRLEGRPYSIAGVMPASFLFPDRKVDLWWPYPVDGPDGARPSAIVRQLVGQGLRVVGLACLCGLALAAVCTRVLFGMLYGVSPGDPFTLAGVVGIALAVGSLAAMVPAVRASQTEPMRVLREE